MGEAEMQKFCLTWKDFNKVFNKEFTQLRQSGDFFDVTLACEDGQVPAHKLVLSAASDLFKQILKKNSHEHPLIFLYGIRIADVHSILEFIYNGETEVAENGLEMLLSTGGNLRIKGLTEASETKGSEEEEQQLQQTWKEQFEANKGGDQSPSMEDEPDHTERRNLNVSQSSLINVSQFLSPSSPIETGCTTSIPGRSLPPEAESPQEDGHDSPTAGCSPPRGDCSPPRLTFSPVRRNDSPSILGPWSSGSTPRKLGHQRALVQGNNENETELNRQVAQLMVSSYDPVLGKTIWQCAQCHYSSKLRYTVKEHVETHISGFCHQCPLCSKTCKTRNALRVHTIRKHNQRSIANCDTVTRVVNPQAEQSSPEFSVKSEAPTEYNKHQAEQMGSSLMSHPIIGLPIGGFLGHPILGRPDIIGRPGLSLPIGTSSVRVTKKM